MPNDSSRGTVDREGESYFDAAAQAYWLWVLGRGDAARMRAQGAFTMVTAIAAALVAGGVLGNVENEPDAVKGLGMAAVALWLLAAGLLLFGAVKEDPVDNPSAGDADSEAFLSSIIAEQATERDKTYDRLDRALRVAAVAMAVTAIALGWALFDDQHGKPSRDAIVTLDPKARSAATTGCSRRLPEHVPAKVDPGDLSSDLVELKLAAGVCDEDATSLELPLEVLRGVRTSK